MGEQKIFGISVDGQHEHYFKRDELLFIQNWKKNSKFDIPMFYTQKGRFTVCTTLESAQATVPTFECFHKWNVVNKLAISRIESTQFGCMVCFKDTDITTEISLAKYKNLDLHCPIREDRFIVVTKDKLAQWLPLEEVCYIDLPESKRGARILRIHTKDDMFSMSMTLRQYSGILELTQVDNGVYTNIDNIKCIELSPYGAILHFIGSHYKTTIARQRVKLLQEFIPIIDEGSANVQLLPSKEKLFPDPDA